MIWRHTLAVMSESYPNIMLETLNVSIILSIQWRFLMSMSIWELPGRVDDKHAYPYMNGLQMLLSISFVTVKCE